MGVFEEFQQAGNQPAPGGSTLFDEFQKTAPAKKTTFENAGDIIRGLEDSSRMPATARSMLRTGGSAVEGLMQGSADVVDTLNQPGVWLLGPEKLGAMGPTSLAKWLRETSALYAPTAPKKLSEKVESMGGNIAGEVVPAIVGWEGRVPYAVMHGIHVAQQQAEQQKRKMTFGEAVHYAIVEGTVRKILGVIGDTSMGRVTKGLAFGAGQGITDVSEGRSKEDGVIDTAVSGVVGMIAPGMSAADRARVGEAQASWARGDGKGAMQHLDPLLKKYGPQIARAARTVQESIRESEPEEPPKPLPDDREVKRDVDASLAVRIAQSAHYVSVMKGRMDGWENSFKGMPSADRVDLMTRYQEGGVKNVPEEWQPFFKDFETLHHDMQTSEHAAGIDYEVRENYIQGLWRDPAKAKAFFGQKGGLRPGYGKPGFTKEKVFQSYMDGIKAGLEPLSTNPAVIAAWRMEAGARAMTRILAMGDMVHDGFAVRAKDLEGYDPGSPFNPIQSRYPGWKETDVGGTRYLVHPEAARLLDWAFTLDRQALAKIVGFDPNGRAMTGATTLGKAWMMARNATIPLKLSLSAFHALHILGIDAVQPMSNVLTQSLNRKISFNDAASALRNADHIAQFGYGRHLGELYHKPIDELSDNEKLELNIMTLGGFSPRMPSTYEVRAEENWRRLVNDTIPRLHEEIGEEGLDKMAAAMKMSKPMLQGAALQIGRLMESVQGPLFRTWIPALKAAAYMNEAKLAITSHPELLDGSEGSNALLRQRMRSIAKSIDNRYGEMAYDRVFMPRVIRMGLMGSLLSMGWNYGFLREFGGALADAGWLHEKSAPAFVKPAIRGEVSSRIVYASVYTSISMMLGGMMTWMMTGTPPSSVTDLIYPRMPDGTRRNTMSFTREFGAMWNHVASEGLATGAWKMFENKLVQQLTTLDEVLENQDYYGRQINDPNADIATRFAQSMKYVTAAFFSPISLQSTVTGAEPTPAGTALSFGGFSPAPKYVTKPSIQNAIENSYSTTHGQRIVPYAEVARSDDTRNLKQAYKRYIQTHSAEDQKAYNDLLGPYVQKYGARLGKGGRYLKEMLRDWMAPDAGMEFRELDPETQYRILRQASPEERAPYMSFARPEVRAKF